MDMIKKPPCPSGKHEWYVTDVQDTDIDTVVYTMTCKVCGFSYERVNK